MEVAPAAGVGPPEGRTAARVTRLMADDRRVAVLGAGMHPWGKWGRNFVEYGLAAARDALADAGVAWTDVQFVSGADTIRNGYPGFVAGATFAQALGLDRRPGLLGCYAACASGAAAIANARAQILAGLCDVALVVGADTTPKGFFAPVGGERQDDPDWLRFHLLGATNPTYFGLYARRRMDRYGATDEDFAQVKVKNARHGLANPYARYRKEVTVDEVLASPVVADPLRLLEICATSDGGAALVLSRLDFARQHGHGAAGDPLVTVSAVSTVTPRFPNTVIEMPNFSTDSAAAGSGDVAASGRRSPAPPTRRPASAPTTWTWPRSTTCRRRSSSTGTRTSGCAARARPRSCCATAPPPSGAGCRSTRAAGSRASARPSRPRPSPRSASRSGSCGARPTVARWRAPGWPSPPTRACSATVPR